MVPVQEEPKLVRTGSLWPSKFPKRTFLARAWIDETWACAQSRAVLVL
jgi:hypothetical protein